jgi:hypothetical protein
MTLYGREDWTGFVVPPTTTSTNFDSETAEAAYERGKKDGYDEAVRMIKLAVKALKRGKKAQHG